MDFNLVVKGVFKNVLFWHNKGTEAEKINLQSKNYL
jgi:hypothetical protein